MHWAFGDVRITERGLLLSSEGAREAAQSRSFARHPVARSFVEFSFFEAGEGGGLHAKSFLLEQSKADFDNCTASSALAMHPGLCIRAFRGQAKQIGFFCHATQLCKLGSVFVGAFTGSESS